MAHVFPWTWHAPRWSSGVNVAGSCPCLFTVSGTTDPYGCFTLGAGECAYNTSFTGLGLLEKAVVFTADHDFVFFCLRDEPANPFISGPFSYVADACPGRTRDGRAPSMPSKAAFGGLWAWGMALRFYTAKKEPVGNLPFVLYFATAPEMLPDNVLPHASSRTSSAEQIAAAKQELLALREE